MKFFLLPTGENALVREISKSSFSLMQEHPESPYNSENNHTALKGIDKLRTATIFVEFYQNSALVRINWRRRTGALREILIIIPDIYMQLQRIFPRRTVITTAATAIIVHVMHVFTQGVNFSHVNHGRVFDHAWIYFAV